MTGAYSERTEEWKEVFDDRIAIDRYVYHYTNRKSALGGIVPLRQLRASPRAWLDDPLDNEQLDVVLHLSGDEAADPQSRAKIQRIFTDTVNNNCKILCFTMDAKSTGGRSPVEFRGFGHSAMWSHYADHHSGVCLIFDMHILDSEIRSSWSEFKFVRSGIVKYCSQGAGLRSLNDSVDQRIFRASEAEEQLVQSRVDRYAKELFFTKLSDWSTESEYRWIARTEDRRPAFVSVNNSLRGIVIGGRFPDDDVPMLRQLCDDSEIVLARMRFIDGTMVVSPNLLIDRSGPERSGS